MNDNFEFVELLKVHPGIRMIASKKAMRNQKKKALWVALFGNKFYIRGRTWIYRVDYPYVRILKSQGGYNPNHEMQPKFYRKLK